MVGCPNGGLSEWWAVRMVGCQNGGLSEWWAVGIVGCTHYDIPADVLS